MSVLQKLYRGELHQALSEEQRELFERYKNASAEVENLEQEDYFCKGLVLGARLMQEIATRDKMESREV